RRPHRFFRVRRRGAQRLARRIVQRLPGVFALLDQVGDEDAGDGRVRHAGAAVAGDDVDIAFVHGIAADKGETVDALHDLAGPRVRDVPDGRKSFTRPTLEALVVERGIVCLTGTMIFTADDQYFLLLIVNVLQADVVVRVARIPVERAHD